MRRGSATKTFLIDHPAWGAICSSTTLNTFFNLPGDDLRCALGRLSWAEFNFRGIKRLERARVKALRLWKFWWSVKFVAHFDIFKHDRQQTLHWNLKICDLRATATLLCEDGKVSRFTRLAQRAATPPPSQAQILSTISSISKKSDHDEKANRNVRALTKPSISVVKLIDFQEKPIETLV